MQMTDRERERVSGIVWLRNLRQPEERFDHQLHLMLLRAPITDDGAFNFERRVFSDWNTSPAGDEHRNAADLAKFESALHIERRENIFDGDLMRLKPSDQIFEALAQHQESLGKRSAHRQADRPVFHGCVLSSVALDQTEPSDCASGIKSQDSQSGHEAPRLFSLRAPPTTAGARPARARASKSRSGATPRRS